MFILFISKWKWGDFRRVGKEQSGPCVSRTLSVWSEVLWAPGVAKILGFRWNKMGRWENEASLFRSYYLTDLPALWSSVGNSVSCSRLLSVSSFICISGRSFFFFSSVAWRSGREGRAVIGHFECEEKLPSPLTFLNFVSWFLYIFNYTFISVHRCRLQAAVTFPDGDIACPLYSLTQSLWRTLTQPLRSVWVPQSPHLTYSTKHSAGFFVLETFVPLVLSNKIMHSTKGYMPRFIDRSLKYFFYSCKSWQGKNQNQRKKNLHVYLIRREVKKTGSELRGGGGELMND